MYSGTVCAVRGPEYSSCDWSVYSFCLNSTYSTFFWFSSVSAGKMHKRPSISARGRCQKREDKRTSLMLRPWCLQIPLNGNLAKIDPGNREGKDKRQKHGLTCTVRLQRTIDLFVWTRYLLICPHIVGHSLWGFLRVKTVFDVWWIKISWTFSYCVAIIRWQKKTI